jgi:hypothetical protein
MEYSYQVIKPGSKRERYVFNITMENFFKLLYADHVFRETIVNIFINSEFEYVYWQFPIYSSTSKDQQAQFDLVQSTPFKKADPHDFADKFIGKSQGEIIVFKNKSGDTDLISVVPTKAIDINNSCSDIMSFMVRGHSTLKANLLKTIGREMISKHNPCYLSTHGKGVEWIHIRLCNKPKYYV